MILNLGECRRQRSARSCRRALLWLRGVTWVCLSLLLVNCHALLPLEADGTCGNRVLEPLAGEDCDTFGTEVGTRCGTSNDDRACHFLCGVDDDAVCPAGWRCGLDGVCRSNSMSYGSSTVVGIDGSALQAGDFDGDGRDDLVTVAAGAITVAYGDDDGDGELMSITASSPDQPATFSDINGDGRSDVLLPLVDGVQLFSGSEFRDLLPLSIPETVYAVDATTAAFPIRAAPPYNLDHTLLMKAASDGLQLEIDGRDTRLTGLGGLLPTTTTRLPPRFVVQNFDDVSGDLPDDQARLRTEEVFIAFGGSNHALLLDVFCADQPDPPAGAPPPPPDAPIPPCDISLRQQVSLGAFTVQEGGATYVADYDGDGILDAFVEVEGDGGATALVVATRFTDDAELVTYTGFDDVIGCRGCPPEESSGLRGIADFNGDHVADFVSRDGIFLAEGDGVIKKDGPNRPWKDAHVLDVNHDGLLDVVGSGPYAMDLMLSNGEGLFNKRELDDAANSIHTAFGDFDGDFAIDIAAVKEPGQVEIYFGTDRGPVGPGVVMASLPQVSTFSAMRSLVSDDGIDDLLVDAPSRTDGERVRISLQGASSRRMVAPLVKSGRVYSFADAGHFARLDAIDVLTVEIVAGGPDLGPQLGFFMHDSPEFGRADVHTTQLTVDDDCVLPRDYALAHVRADVDNDGLDEIVVLEQWSGRVVNDEPTAVDWRGAILDFTADAVECTPLPTFADEAGPTALFFVDVDGDDQQDIVSYFDPDADQASMELRGFGSRGFVVWWGEGDAQFSAPELLPAGNSDQRIAVAALQADDDDAMEFVLLAKDDMLITDLAGRSASSHRVGSAPLGARSIISADMNADGLDDIVVGRDDSSIVYWQQPCAANDIANGDCQRTSP